MKNQSVTSVIRGASRDALRRAFSSAAPDQIYDLEIRSHVRGPRIGTVDRARGEAFHEALSQGFSGQWVAPQYFPFVRVIKDWLDDEGVTRSLSEWEFRGSKAVRGRCDLLVKGGPNQRGVIETKLKGPKRLPQAVLVDDLLELSLYTATAAERFHDYDRFWGALVYVHPASHLIRVFEWRTMGCCCEAANQILKVA